LSGVNLADYAAGSVIDHRIVDHHYDSVPSR